MPEDISLIILEELRAHRTESKANHVAMDKRVRSLEGTRSEARGMIKMAVLIASVISAVISYLITIFKH